MHQGALGDFLLTLPILTGLYRSYPLIQMNLWTKPEHIALLAEEPFLGKDCPPDDSELHPFFHDELWITARVPRFLQGAQAIGLSGSLVSIIPRNRNESARTPLPSGSVSPPGVGCRRVPSQTQAIPRRNNTCTRMPAKEDSRILRGCPSTHTPASRHWWTEKDMAFKEMVGARSVSSRL